jgi:mono/diheme cytochrome c family protein
MINKRRVFQMKKTFLPISALLLVLALAISACGGAPAEPPPPPAPVGDPVKGEELFVTCAACHGPKGEGVAGLGKDMTTSEFIAGKSDDELVEFIKVGRAPDDPLNTTGVAMLPKGGNPSLSDEDLYDLVAYIRTLKK